MTLQTIPCLMALSIGVSIWTFIVMWKNFHRARAVEDTPTAKITSAPQGGVEVFGKARPVPGISLSGPLTGIPCLWFYYKVELYERRGKNSAWVVVSSGESREPFFVEDDTGQALVAPLGAEISTYARRVWRGYAPSPLNPSEGGGSFVNDYRYTEDLIVPGDPLYVLGWFETLSGTPSHDSAVREKLREMKQNPTLLKSRFDANQDGELSVEEWDRAREHIEAEVRSSIQSRPPSNDVHTIHSPPQGVETPFLISSLSQEELGSRFQRRARWGLVAFLTSLAMVGILIVLNGRRL